MTFVRSRAHRWVGVAAVIVSVLGVTATAARAGWTTVMLPAGRSPTPPHVYQVSCASPRACFALGAGQVEPFVRITGTRASRLTAPRLGDHANVNALACPSATACFAVGDSGRETDHGLLALRWSDGRWATMRLPVRSAPTVTDQLGGLSCPSERMCVAVGTEQGTTGRSVVRPLLFRWDGRRWSSVSAPPGTTGSILSSVSCGSPRACTAVGETGGEKGDLEPFALRLSAGRWSRVTLRMRVAHALGFDLTSVSCPAASDCLATGVTEPSGGGASRIVSLRESRGGWTAQVPPLPRLPRRVRPHLLTDFLGQVSCSAVGRCLGVGSWINDRGDGAGGGLSLATTPTGPDPVVRTRRGDPQSVSCPSAADCLVGGVRSITRYTP